MKRLVIAALLILSSAAVAQPGPLSPKQFGAVGDGKADDTAALRKWLEALTAEGLGYCPGGTYRITDSLVQPPHTTILGSHRCVIKPARTGDSHIAFAQSPGSRLEGIMLDGSDAPAGTIGLGFITSSGGVADDGYTRNVFIGNFYRTGSIGIRVLNVVSWHFEDTVTDHNYVNFDIGRKGGDQTTTIWIGNGLFKSAITTGLLIESGQEITLAGGILENNGGAGLLADASGSPGVIRSLAIGPNTHFESNWLSLAAGSARNAQYNLILNAVQDFALRDGMFQGAAKDARAMNVVDVRGYVLDNVRVPRAANQINIAGVNSVGTVLNWPPLNGPVQSAIAGRH